MALDEGQCTEAPWGAASTKATGSWCAWSRVSNGQRGQGAEDVWTESEGMNK